MTESLENPIQDEPCVEGVDYYMDGPYFVFTATYHRKRGFCCGSGCKHCPYREQAPGNLDEVDSAT